MLVLAPTPEKKPNQKSVKHTIALRLSQLQTGQIETLMTDTRFNNNWTPHNPRPSDRIDNSAAQLAADSDNYTTAITRACNFNKIATIDESNKHIVKKLYPKPAPGNNHPPIYTTNNQKLHLPGDICSTISHIGRNKGTGLHCDSIDAFINLVKLRDAETNTNIQQLFNLVYQGNIPTDAKDFFTDTYLFCLHKDPNDTRKLRPIGIPTAIRRIIARHIAQQWKEKFALHLLPFNFAVGVPNGMDFIVKSMQLSIDRFIKTKQSLNSLPTRAAVFVDLTNMFNSVSRDELFDIIHQKLSHS
jgi:hypothetical protein